MERAYNVLVVDDEPVNVRITLAHLARLGHAADAVEDGARALEQLARRRYDAVLMDCHMPNLDGYETTRRLRVLEHGSRRTPVIAVTAYAVVGERERCLAAGMDDYLAKPFRAEELGAILTRWLGQGAADEAPAAAAPAVAMDEGIVATLRQLGILGRVVPLFLGKLDERLSTLRARLAGGDLDSVRSIAHTLCGASGQVGAAGFSAACRRVEHAAAAGDAAAVAAALDEVEAVAPATVAALDAELRGRR